MSSKIFNFKQFSISQPNSAMKLTTDAVVFGALIANILKYSLVLDVGTGTGILSLILAQFNPNSQILGIDIDDGAVSDAEFNFKNSVYTKSLNAQKLNFKEFNTQTLYDLIISNPPYFKKSLDYKSLSREYARNQDSLTSYDIFYNAKRLLVKTGFIAIVIPHSYYKEYLKEATKQGLHLNFLSFISSKEGLKSYLVIMVLSKETSNKIDLSIFKNEQVKFHKIKEKVFVRFYLNEQEGKRSSFFSKLTQSLYLNS